MANSIIKWYYKTKIVRAKDMDFSEARYFDEEERLEAIAAEQQAQEKSTEKTTWAKRARYLVFG